MLNPSTETASQDSADAAALNWSADSPRGGRAVLARALKENATTVPLFLAQTMVSSLRDVGYNHTTSALCEHVDNAIEAGATEVWLYFRQTGKPGKREHDIAVYDNGRGMAPNVLKVATSFGGSMSFNNRAGIGRFGMGMKTAALSIAPTLELYSWQEPRAFYSMTLDVEEIGKDKSNLVQLPEPTMHPELPSELAEIFTRPMGTPDRAQQNLLANSADELIERLGKSGTIVFMPQCDRLTYSTAKTQCEHATLEMARIYRRYIEKGLKLYINNRQVDAFDPTYAMAEARHTHYLPDGMPRTSRLYVPKTIEVPTGPEKDAPTAKVQIRIYKLPIEEWDSLATKVKKNDLKVFDGRTVTILRNDREVAFMAMPDLTTRHSVTYWYRIQIDFPGELDEAFGVASNKQGVRLKDYVRAAIKKEIGVDITTINADIKRYQAQNAAAREGSQAAASERRASDVDHQHAKPLGPDLTAEEQQQLDANLRGLVPTVKRQAETDEQAFERIKSSTYLMVFRHDDFWPFYHVQHRFGRILLTINTAHPFYTQLYEPLRKFALAPPAEDGSETESEPQAEDPKSPVVALELMLLSLGRATSVLGGRNDDAAKAFDTLSREWSDTYRIQLTP